MILFSKFYDMRFYKDVSVALNISGKIFGLSLVSNVKLDRNSVIFLFYLIRGREHAS
jgi:hypothetical protein